MLTFHDDTQVGVIGLAEVMAGLHSEGKKATDQTAEEIIRRLETRGNYIPSAERARREYAYVLLKEYRKYVKDRESA